MTNRFARKLGITLLGLCVSVSLVALRPNVTSARQLPPSALSARPDEKSSPKRPAPLDYSPTPLAEPPTEPARRSILPPEPEEPRPTRRAPEPREASPDRGERPEQKAEVLMESLRKEAESALKALDREAEQLQERLRRIEAARTRLRAVARCLGDEADPVVGRAAGPDPRVEEHHLP